MLGDVSRERAQAPGLEARPPKRLSDHEAGGFELGFEARRAHAPVYGVVHFRMRGEKTFREAALSATSSGAEHAPLTVAARVDAPQAGVLEYYADALSAEGPLRAGSEAQPLELPVPEPRRSAPRSTTNKKLNLVWLAIPAGIIAGTAVGLGLFYGLRSR